MTSRPEDDTGERAALAETVLSRYADQMASTPPREVLDAFGLEGSCRLVEGGQRTTYRVGDFALKPCDRAEESEWIGTVLASLTEEGFRVARPRRSRDGCFVVSGWTAFNWVVGVTDIRGRWREAISALRSFHATLSRLARPDLLAHRDDPYSRCDCIAWGEVPGDTVGNLGVEGERLLQRISPLDLRCQIIQGDPSEGNLLFADGHAPAIIDFVPYWRPADYSLALLLSDGIAWSAAPVAVLDDVRDVPHMGALLARAVLFRLSVGKVLRGGDEGVAERTRAYLPVIRAAERLGLV